MSYSQQEDLIPSLNRRIKELEALVNMMAEALEFYGDESSMSCRLRSRYDDTPKCLTGDSEYFQDPADLPIVQDGGKRARTCLDAYRKAIEV